MVVLWMLKGGTIYWW